MFRDLKSNEGAVWYFRDPDANPDDAGMDVVRLVVKHGLPISISSQPDFSDYVDSDGVSHPRPEAGTLPSTNEPHMPVVPVRDDIEEIFAEVRQTAAGASGPRGMVLVQPDRALLIVPALEETPKLSALAAGLEEMIPSAIRRNIAVIAYTELGPERPDGAFAQPSVMDASRSIPFFGLLAGLTYIGHSVWVFEGHPSALAAGCRLADILIVDSAMLPFLEQGWENQAAMAMSNANILIHGRTTGRLCFLRKVGQGHGRMEFQDGRIH